MAKRYSDMNDCSARLPVGGIPTSEIAYKLEETDIGDMGYDNYDDYLTTIANDRDDYMRQAVADRNCEEPFANDETPTYNATQNSGKLNARYNGNRGTTEYQPQHPELFIGDQAEELPIYLSKAKKFSAARADAVVPRMGDNNECTIPEQAWADPDISYAKKDMFKWYGHVYNKWNWPSFVNFQTQNTRFFNPADTMRRRHESIVAADDVISTGPDIRNEQGKVVKSQVGYNYYLHPHTKHNMAFTEHDTNTQRQANSETNPRAINASQAESQLKILDKGVVSNNIKRMDVAVLMKSALEKQEPTMVLGTESKGGNAMRHGLAQNPKSRITKIIKEQSPQEYEQHSKVASAPRYQKDYIKTHYKSCAEIPPWVLGNLHTIKKSAMGQTDQSKVKRDVVQSKDMYKEHLSKLTASSLIQNNVLTANIKDIEQTTVLPYSLYSKAMKEADGGRLDRTRNLVGKTQHNVEYDDAKHTKMMSMPHPSRIQLYGKSELGENTFDQQNGLEQRGYQNWTRH